MGKNTKDQVAVTEQINDTVFTKYYPKQEKYKGELKIRSKIPWTEKQLELIDLIKDKETKAIFIEGPAGTSKTLSAIYASLGLLSEKKIGKIYYCRTVIESASKSMGFLPGDAKDKMQQYLLPLEDKLSELLDLGATKALKDGGFIEGFAVNYARGRNLFDCVLIADECQNMEMLEIQTLMTRISTHAKIIFLADHTQCDLRTHRSDASEVFNLFSDEESSNFGIKKFVFTEDDIVRSDFCKFVVKKFKTINLNKYSQ